MKLSETRYFMERMKVYYPSLIIDDFTTQEWHSQLKDYSSQDINEKFDEHLRSEEYNRYIPKISFLTAYLVKEKDKANPKIDRILVYCPICKAKITVNEYDSHYGKCSSLDYIIRQAKRFKDKNLDRKELEQLSDEKFNELYDKVINMTYELGTPEEKHYIEKYRDSLLND